MHSAIKTSDGVIKMRALIQIVVAAAISVIIWPLPGFADILSAKLKQDIIEAKYILPAPDGKVIVSLCDTTPYEERPPRLDMVLALAEKGNAVAQCSLGFVYQRGYSGSEPDEETARISYQKSAAQGDAVAEELLGEMYENGEHVGQDYAKASEWFQKFSDNKDSAEAAKWARKPVDLRDTQTLCDDTQYSVKPFKPDALRALADKGDAVAQCSLGLAYQRGYVDAKPDDATAASWLQKSAEQGNAKAQYLLASLYQNGERAGQDYAEAYKWYLKAAQQGNIRAQAIIAQAYLTGRNNVPQNDAEAVKWYRRAAEQGNITGADFLADFYRSGTRGSPKDYVHAYMWTLIGIRMRNPPKSDAAKNAFDEQVRQIIANYQQGMTPEQISQGTALAGLWAPVHEQAYLYRSMNDLINGK
jgi:uncharacterized protein